MRLAVLVAFASLVIAPQTLKMGGVSFAETSRTAPYDDGQICVTPPTSAPVYGMFLPLPGKTCALNPAAQQTGILTIGGQPAVLGGQGPFMGGNPTAFVSSAHVDVFMAGSDAFSIQARVESASISVEFDLCMTVSEISTGLQVAIDCISHMDLFRDLNVSGTSTVGTSYRVRVSLAMRSHRCGVPCRVSGATAVSVLGFNRLPPGPAVVLPPPPIYTDPADLTASGGGTYYTSAVGSWTPSVLRVVPGQIVSIANAGINAHTFRAGSPVGTGEQAFVAPGQKAQVPLDRYVYKSSGAWFPLCGDSSLQMCDTGSITHISESLLYGRRTTIQINPSAAPGKYLFWCAIHPSMTGALVVDTPSADLEPPTAPAVSTPAEGASVSAPGNSISFAGTAEPNTAVTLEIVSGPEIPRSSGRAFADSSGNWSTAWSLSNTGYLWRSGDYVYRVAGTDAAGNTSAWETHTFKLN